MRRKNLTSHVGKGKRTDCLVTGEERSSCRHSVAAITFQTIDTKHSLAQESVL